MGYAVLALDDEAIGSSELQQGIASPAFVKRVRWGCAMAKVARNLDGVDPDRIFAWSEGLGGGVALAVSALDERGLACTAVATGGISSMPNTLMSASTRSKTKSSTFLTKRSTRVLWPRRPGHCQQEWVA